MNNTQVSKYEPQNNENDTHDYEVGEQMEEVDRKHKK